MVAAVLKKRESAEEREFRQDIADMEFSELCLKYVGLALKTAKVKKNYSRAKVAELLTNRSGKKVTEAMLNKYTRQDGQGASIPLDLIELLIEITGDIRLALIMPLRRGMKVLTGDEIDLYHYFMAKAKEDEARQEREYYESRLLKKNDKR